MNAVEIEEAVSRLAEAPFAQKTIPTELVEHVFNVLDSLEFRHVGNVPHVRSGVLPETIQKAFPDASEKKTGSNQLLKCKTKGADA